MADPVAYQNIYLSSRITLYREKLCLDWPWVLLNDGKSGKEWQ